MKLKNFDFGRLKCCKRFAFLSNFNNMFKLYDDSFKIYCSAFQGGQIMIFTGETKGTK